LFGGEQRDGKKNEEESRSWARATYLRVAQAYDTLADNDERVARDLESLK
jgi:hypothetical protein